MARKHYVEYFYPGVLFAETSVEPIKDRKAKVKHPRGCYAYRFFSREEVKKNGKTLMGENTDYSGFHFFGGTVYTLAEVKKQFPKEDILIRNMENNKYEKVIRTSMGNWVPLNKRDRVVDSEKAKAQEVDRIKKGMGY